MKITSWKPIACGHYFGEAKSTRGRPYRFGVAATGEFLWTQSGEREQARDGQRLWLCEVTPPAALVVGTRERLRILMV